MAKQPVLAPKVTTSWGIDHYAAIEAEKNAPAVEETAAVEETPEVQEVVEDVE